MESNVFPTMLHGADLFKQAHVLQRQASKFAVDKIRQLVG